VRDDVLIVGAGPAGAVAATVLARAGARVRLVDRATFPRPKLCGDTVNPGTLALLGRLGMAGAVGRAAWPIDGWIVTGEGGAAVEGRYPRPQRGWGVTRAVLDLALVEEAVASGVVFEPGLHVRGAIVERSRSGGVIVRGASVASGPDGRALHARVTIAADGRHSTLAFGLGLVRHPVRPRRWAVGAYFEQVAGLSSLGEMHVRVGRYIGIAPLAGGLANVCLVQGAAPAAGAWRDPGAVLRRALAADRRLGDRFRTARLVGAPAVLGPLAVDAVRNPPDGLILAGDAAGFVDPMTGDGLRFAVRGGELAALAALSALEDGWGGVQVALQRARAAEFAGKWRFNRALRSVVGSPLACRAAAVGARVAPGLVRALIGRAGDCDLVRAEDRRRSGGATGDI
jgi:flavin-dependent dehydrogenase